MNILLRRRKLGHGTCIGLKAASTTGLEVLRNDAAFPGELNYVFRWGCTTTIPQREGVKVVNKAEAIHWCSNKRQGRLDMQAADVSVPETWTHENFVGEISTILAESHHSGLSGMFVSRTAQHAQGRNLLAGTSEELLFDSRFPSHAGGYVSRLIDKVAEYRVMVCQNRVVWVAKKTPGNPDDVAWNVAQGGRFDNVKWGEWPMAVVKEALRAANVSGTDFCGVDVMADARGWAYVLEVNSAPSQTSEYRQQCLAKAFDHIVQNGKEPFPDVVGGLNWKNAIHPAVWSSSRD